MDFESLKLFKAEIKKKLLFCAGNFKYKAISKPLNLKFLEEFRKMNPYPYCMMLIVFIALFGCDFTVDTKCFRVFKSCSDPSKNLCASGNPPTLMPLGEEFKVLYNQLNLSGSQEDQCFNHPVFAFCSWICTGDVSCVGLNFFHSRDYVGDPSEYCQLFSDFPQDYHYSDNCSFLTVTNFNVYFLSNCLLY